MVPKPWDSFRILIFSTIYSPLPGYCNEYKMKLKKFINWYNIRYTYNIINIIEVDKRC